MNEKSSTISICIPLFNPNEIFLVDLFDSIHKQNYPDLECIVVDDASPGNTRNLVEKYSSKLNIQYHKNNHNLGMAKNWNKAVSYSTGDLVMVVGQDDILREGMLRNYAKVFLETDNVAMCSSARNFINQEGIIITPPLNVNDRKNIFLGNTTFSLSSSEILKLCLRNGNPYGEPSAVMFTREVFDAVGGYDPIFKHAADVDFIIRASKYGKSIYLTTPYLYRRRHDQNLTNLNIETGIVSIDRLQIFLRFSPDPSLNASDLSRIKVSLVSHATYDIFKSFRLRNWQVIKSNLKTLLHHCWVHPKYYQEHIIEIISKDNIDAKWINNCESSS